MEGGNHMYMLTLFGATLFGRISSHDQYEMLGSRLSQVAVCSWGMCRYCVTPFLDGSLTGITFQHGFCRTGGRHGSLEVKLPRFVQKLDSNPMGTFPDPDTIKGN